MSAAEPSPQRSEATERYLEAIYYIEHEGEVPRPGRLAEWLGVLVHCCVAAVIIHDIPQTVHELVL